LQEPAEFTPIWLFGLKTNHLATLVRLFTSCLLNNLLLQFGISFFSLSKQNKYLIQGLFLTDHKAPEAFWLARRVFNMCRQRL
jgi:hypothetical protein